MPEDVASNEGLGHAQVAGVKAMRHFSGAACRVARSRPWQRQAWALASARRAGRPDRRGGGVGLRCECEDAFVQPERARERRARAVRPGMRARNPTRTVEKNEEGGCRARESNETEQCVET